MKIKVIIAGGFRDEDERFELDDVRTVTDERGKYFCRAGWVRDISGKVATATPSRDEVILKVDNTKLDNKVGDA